MQLLILSLYVLSCLALLLMAALVYRRRPRALLHRYFAAGSLFVVLWLASLYLYSHTAHEPTLLVLGRINFMSVLFVALTAYLFVEQLVESRSQFRGWLFGVTAVLSIVTLITPAIAEAELLRGGERVTAFGRLFLLYAVWIAGLLGAAVYALVRRPAEAPPRQRAQRSVIAFGVGVSTLVALTTNLILPFRFGIFRLQEIGALSIVATVAAFGYAILAHRLFDVRIVIKKAVVLAVMVALIQQAYSGLITLMVGLLPESALSREARQAITLGAVIFIAATFDPIKKRLEQIADRVLFGSRRRRMGA